MKALLFLLLLFICIRLPAQKKGQALLDSLLPALSQMKEDSSKVNALLQVAQTYMLVSPRAGFEYAQNGLTLAEKINWQKGVAMLHNSLGLMVGDSGNNTLARVHFEKSLGINKSLNAQFPLISNLNNIGRTYQRESNFSKATDYFFKAYAIATEIRNNEQMALVGTNITACFYTQKNFKKAGLYAAIALKNARIANTPNHIAKSLMQMGLIKAALKDTINGKKYLDSAFEVYNNLNNRPAMAQVLANQATLEYPNYKKAIEKMSMVQQIMEEIAPQSVTSIANLTNLGSTYYELAKQTASPEKSQYLKKSGEYLSKAKSLAEQTSNKEYLANISISLADLEEVRGNYKLALENYKQYSNINDSLFSQDKKNEIAGIEGKHQLILKDKEIAINQLQLTNERSTRFGLITALALAAIIGLLIYLQSMHRKKTNKTLLLLNAQLDEANKIKAKFFGILSHDLRSPVADLMHFLQLQKDRPDLMAAEQREQHQQEISQSAEDLLNTMETMLIWSKDQMGSFKPQISDIPVSELFNYIERFFPKNNLINITFTQERDQMITADKNYLQVIMQNLTANAIKAVKGNPSASIEWKAVAANNSTMLTITDNGPGITTEQANTLFEEGHMANTKNGLGLQLVKELSKAINYKISIQSKPGMGSSFTIAAAGTHS
jgi:signal transduction histidine kinase